MVKVEGGDSNRRGHQGHGSLSKCNNVFLGGRCTRFVSESRLATESPSTVRFVRRAQTSDVLKSALRTKKCVAKNTQ